MIFLQVEIRSVNLEKQVKEMAGLQLQLDTEREEKRLLQEQLQVAKASSSNLTNMKIITGRRRQCPFHCAVVSKKGGRIPFKLCCALT